MSPNGKTAAIVNADASEASLMGGHQLWLPPEPVAAIRYAALQSFGEDCGILFCWRFPAEEAQDSSVLFRAEKKPSSQLASYRVSSSSVNVAEGQSKRPLSVLRVEVEPNQTAMVII